MSLSDSISDSQWRTDVTQIVSKFMRQRLNKRGYQWTIPSEAPVTGSEHQTLIQSMNLIADSMLRENGPAIRVMCVRAVSQNTLDYASFRVIADEMFTEGFQWPLVVMLLLFGSEMAFVLGVGSESRQSNENLVNQVNEWLIRYLCSNQNLKQWILSHGRWNGLVQYTGVSSRKITSGTLMLLIGSVATVTLATVLHFFVKA